MRFISKDGPLLTGCDPTYWKVMSCGLGISLSIPLLHKSKLLKINPFLSNFKLGKTTLWRVCNDHEQQF
jgi:hypothetical protein